MCATAPQLVFLFIDRSDILRTNDYTWEFIHHVVLLAFPFVPPIAVHGFMSSVPFKVAGRPENNHFQPVGPDVSSMVAGGKAPGDDRGLTVFVFTFGRGGGRLPTCSISDSGLAHFIRTGDMLNALDGSGWVAATDQPSYESPSRTSQNTAPMAHTI